MPYSREKRDRGEFMKAAEEKKKSVSRSEVKMVRRQFFRLLPFQVLLLVVNSLNGIIASIFASNLIGQDAMTAIGLFGPINHLLYAVSIMLVSGSQILCGKYMAKNDDGNLQNVFSVDLAFTGIVSVIFALVLAIGSRFNLAALFVSTEAEGAALNEYFLGMAIGIPGLILGQQLFAFLSMENKTRRTMAASLVSVIVNTALDFLFVYVLDMETFGLALASSLSLWAFFLVMALFYMAGKSEMMKFSFKGLRFRESGNIIRLGYPGSFSRFMEMFRCFVVNALIIKHVGSAGMSSFAASNSVMSLFWTLPFGMLAVTRMLLSISIGAEDRESTETNVKVSLSYGVLVMGCVALLIILLAVPFTRLFFRDPSDAAYGMTVMALRILPLCMPLSVISLTFSCYYQIMEKKLWSVLIPLFDGFLFVVLLSFGMIPAFGMTGLYVANVLNGVLCFVAVVCFSIADTKRFPRSVHDLMAMPKDFGAGEGEYLEFSVRNAEDVVSVAETVQDFCMSRGIEHRRSMLSALALEEMAGNVVEHGFEKDRKQHSVDIRVSCVNNEVILRIRDDCVPFDPSDRLEIMDKNDRIKDTGLRMVMNSAKDATYYSGISLAYGISKDVIYNNVLGLNVLVIRL